MNDTDQDAGLAAIKSIHAAMKVEGWSTWNERGFAWWGKDFRQRVWSDPAVDDDGFLIFRLHARTDLLEDFELSRQNVALLAAANAFATTSALVPSEEDPTRIELCASVFVHAETLDWVQRLFGLVVAMQAADAQIKGPQLAEVFETRLAISSHPTGGLRPEADEMLRITEQVIIPRGRAASTWRGPQMEDVLALIQENPHVILATGDQDELTAEFPFLGEDVPVTVLAQAQPLETSLFQAVTTQPNPELGHGLLLILQLPLSLEATEAQEESVRLNQRELQSFTRAHFFGSWCAQGDTLAFVAFFPNAARIGGNDLQNLVISAAARAKWVAEEVYGGDWHAKTEPIAGQQIYALMNEAIADQAGSRPAENHASVWRGAKITAARPGGKTRRFFRRG
jgi:hypothetical protein